MSRQPALMAHFFRGGIVMSPPRRPVLWGIVRAACPTAALFVLIPHKYFRVFGGDAFCSRHPPFPSSLSGWETENGSIVI